MKLLAVTACAVLVLLFSSSLRAAASQHGHVSSAAHLSLSLPVARLGHVVLRRVDLPLDSATATAAPGGTATAVSTTPTPTATTGPVYPDPVTILQNMGQVLDLLTTVHFQEIAVQQGAIALSIHATGDALCHGPSLRAHVVAKASVSGTAQHQKSTFDLIQIKNKLYYKSGKTKHRWEPTKAKAVSPFGFAVENPLSCPNTTTSGGGGNGGTQDQIKDLVNQGPDTIAGVAVWHIHATDVQVDSSGATSESGLDWYISQDHSLLYRFVISFADTTQNVQGSLTTNLTKFGEHIKVSAPKKGSTKP